MLLEPEEGNRQSPALSEHVINSRSRNRTTNEKHAVIERAAMAEDSSNECTPLDLSMKDKTTPSTSRDGTQEASSTLGAYTTISDDTLQYQRNTQRMPMTDETCNVDDADTDTDNGTTSCLPLGPTRNIDNVKPSRSRAGMEEASASFEDGATNATGTGGMEEQGSCGVRASVQSSAKKLKHKCQTCAFLTTPGSTSGTQPTPITGGTCNVGGVTDNGSYQHLGSTSSIDNARPSTSLAGMVEASASFEDYATCRNATGTGGRELQELGGVSGNVPSGRSALHGYPMEPTGHTANIYKASGESSLKQSKLAEHCRKRSRENHKCESCGKQFYRSDHLVRHYRTHTDERPYKCKICDKMFRRPYDLDVHKRIHAGERPYKCEICDKSFSHRSTLRKHQLTHSDEKPHVCLICTRAFKAKDSLKRHLNLNCRYGALVCDMCNLSFPDNSQLSHHRQAMHGDKTPH
ncbi:zinc finger protein 567-like isoform X2 [Dermacentor albipictus]|uniref:zinc finger protein 567-like isoform X2 n=1 Tax=Dermacentor albipictus TaxID=60249 RepID=UPI0038FC92A8